MKKIILKELEFLKNSNVDYADIRIVDTVIESINTENQQVKNINNSKSKGFGIRVYLDGSLGFASSHNFDKLHETAVKALEIAKASRLVQKVKINLSEKDSIQDKYSTPIEKDPFEVPLKEKIDLLLQSEEKMNKSAALSRTLGIMKFQKQEKIFADTEGSYITQTLYESGAGIEAYANSDNDTQRRSYPAADGHFGTAGYEFIEEMDLLVNSEKIAKEAKLLVKAEECPNGYYDLVIDSDQLQLQIHESIGHPIELDRIFGSEAAFAGMSFVNPEMIKENYRYGSEHVNIVADATVPQALGSFGYDDDGIKAQNIAIIDKGIIKNFLSSRETAVKLGEKSNGTSRADGWKNLPIVRMTNINLLPGNFELAEIFKDIEYGFYLCTNKSWSIDDKRINFQFATEIAYEIKDGKLSGKIFKNPIYSGITPQFWSSCDGVCNEKHWRLYGTPNCGKGQPMQSAHVAHGSSPARFRKVKVGVEDVK